MVGAATVRVVFCGTPQFAVPTLKHLLTQQDIEIVAVITQPDRPRGRGMHVSFSAVKETTVAAGLPVHQPEKIRSPESQEMLQRWAPDCVTTAALAKSSTGFASALNCFKAACFSVSACPADL